ncbi:MAG TPA: nitrite reductase small subunit NirD [Acidimicrobiales bacterium]|nr:nitrite reductase small subunit NirD [Acidimicrobiales bacterium]
MTDTLAVKEDDVSPGVTVRVCSVEDVPRGEGRSARVEGRRIAVFNTATGWYAIANVCPHRGGPLADGLVADTCVICPLHERRFDLATGAPLSGGSGVDAYPVVVRAGQVLVRLAHDGRGRSQRIGPADVPEQGGD